MFQDAAEIVSIKLLNSLTITCIAIKMDLKKISHANYRIVKSKEGENIIARYERFLEMLNEKEKLLFLDWAEAVPQIVEFGLQRTLLTRDRGSILLMVNFDHELLAVLKEVSYLQQVAHDNIPNAASEVSITPKYNLFNV